MFININKTDEKETIKGTWNVMRKTSELQFWIGNPSVDLISGVLRFYPFVTISKKEENPVSVRSNILAIVSIPNSMDVTEIYYMFKELQNEIQVIRVLKTSFINHYSIIIKFKTTESANLFYVKNNQTKFNSIEDDICIIREIETIEMKQEKVDLSPELGPANSKENKNSQEALPKDMFSLTLEQNSPDIKKDWQQLTAYENQYKCPICLEPIPEVQIQDKISSLAKKSAKTSEPHPDFGDSAIISILCGHFFHIACLEKWNESKCPLCRYNQHPLESSKCDFCGTNEALWMCIVCGFIGCAPPDGPMNGHIREHYDISKHIYAVELETKCVFDFSKNGFVQRLLQNIRDGKIIQHESTPMPDKMYQNEELEKRLDNIIYEYNLLLSSQYQSQKEYYQSQLNKASKEHEQKVRKLEEEKKILQEEDRVILERFKEAENEFEDKKKEFFDLKETFTKLDNEKRELEKRNKELTAQQQGLISSHQSLALSQEEEIIALREEAAALAMQIKDLETHIQTKDKLKIAFSKEGVDADNTHILMSSKANKGKKKGK